MWVLLDLRKSFVVPCTRGHNIGAILMWESQVVAYESRLLQGFERNSQVYKKELLAMIHALITWKHYLLGDDFTMHTDHQTLRYFLTQTKLFEKHKKWANFLSPFYFHIVHVERKKNVVAETLSRKPQVSFVTIAHLDELRVMKDQYAKDDDFAKIYD